MKKKYGKYGMAYSMVWDDDFDGCVTYFPESNDPYDYGMDDLYYAARRGYNVKVEFVWPDGMGFVLTSKDARFRPYSFNRFKRLTNRHRAYCRRN